MLCLMRGLFGGRCLLILSMVKLALDATKGAASTLSSMLIAPSEEVPLYMIMLHLLCRSHAYLSKPVRAVGSGHLNDGRVLTFHKKRYEASVYKLARLIRRFDQWDFP